MNQIAFVVLAAVALLNAHVARGDGSGDDNADTNGCKATVNGKSVGLQNGDRYCTDDGTTSITCSDGKFTEDKCPPNSKCLKSPGSFQTLCRELRRNVAAAGAPDAAAPAQPADQTPPKKEEPAPAPAPAPAASPAQAPATDAAPKKGKASNSASKEKSPKNEGKQDDHPAAPADKSQPQAAPAAEKPETCKNGDQTLNTGDRYCVDETTHRVCNYGEWVEDKCPPGSKCLKSPSAWNVLCREEHRNPPQPPHPTENSEPQQPAQKP